MVRNYQISKINRLVLFSIIFFASCTTKGKFEIGDAGKDTVITILAKTTPSNFKLIITGEVDDSFMVNSMILKGGKLNDIVSFDWYDKNVVINYKAYKAKKGRLNFIYNIP